MTHDKDSLKTLENRNFGVMFAFFFFFNIHCSFNSLDRQQQSFWFCFLSCKGFFPLPLLTVWSLGHPTLLFSSLQPSSRSQPPAFAAWLPHRSDFVSTDAWLRAMKKKKPTCKYVPVFVKRWQQPQRKKKKMEEQPPSYRNSDTLMVASGVENCI